MLWSLVPFFVAKKDRNAVWPFKDCVSLIFRVINIDAKERRERISGSRSRLRFMQNQRHVEIQCQAFFLIGNRACVSKNQKWNWQRVEKNTWVFASINRFHSSKDRSWSAWMLFLKEGFHCDRYAARQSAERQQKATTEITGKTICVRH